MPGCQHSSTSLRGGRWERLRIWARAPCSVESSLSGGRGPWRWWGPGRLSKSSAGKPIFLNWNVRWTNWQGTKNSHLSTNTRFMNKFNLPFVDHWHKFLARLSSAVFSRLIRAYHPRSVLGWDSHLLSSSERNHNLSPTYCESVGKCTVFRVNARVILLIMT